VKWIGWVGKPKPANGGVNLTGEEDPCGRVQESRVWQQDFREELKELPEGSQEPKEKGIEKYETLVRALLYLGKRQKVINS